MTTKPDPARVAELFEAVVDLEPDEAATKLREACAGEPELRAAVERLLAHDRAASRDFLASPFAPPAPATEEEPPRAADRMGPYFVLRKLGEGGMGVVYAGYDDALDRKLALKLLRHDERARDWLLREGRALARVEHPHVVGVHAIGEHAGRAFLAMELVEGPSLREWLAERPRGAAEVLDVLLQAGRGLAAVHEAGLVHRDFKPDNVLLGKDGRARVADFGIALPSTPAPEGASVGGLAGTPGFMAPEQLAGGMATPASDQFGFCVTLHRALYAAPLPPDDGAGASRRTAPRPDDVPAWIEPILRRGLARDPGARFASMRALLEAIERHVPRDPEMDPSLARREQRLVLGVAVVFGVLVLAAVLGPDEDARLSGTWALTNLAIATILVTGAAVALFWRRFAKNLYGRRFAALIPGVGLALLAHRLVAVRLGTPALHVLVVDHVLLAVYLAVAAVTIERYLGWLAALALVGAAVSARAPELAPRTFGALTVLITAAAFVVVWRRR